ncbi:MAG: efflux RND transporter periplasmic adaptor subunit [Hyphomicrobiaceae bacterium]
MRRFLSVQLAVAAGGGGYLAYTTNTPFKGWVDSVVGSAPQHAARKKRQIPPAPVRIATVSRTDVPIRLNGIGNVQARSTIAIKARVDGQLMQALVTEGQKVKKGDLLFLLDARPFDAQLKQAEANLARDKANLEKALTDQIRYRELSKKGVSPKTKLEEVDTSVVTLRAQIQASDAAVDLARLNKSYSEIRAPIDGRVGSILLSPGNMVKANDTQAIMMLTQVTPIDVAFALPEQYIQELRDRLASRTPVEVSVKVLGDETTTETGKLIFINNSVDISTGTILLKAEFQNEEEHLVPGQFVKASVLMTTVPNAVTVESKAIQINQKGSYVWIVKPDKTVELRQVAVGPETADLTVISHGLKGGETVVTEGQLRLYPGARVAPVGDSNKTSKGDKSANARG